MATVVPLPVICELHVARRCSSGVGRSADRRQSMGCVIAVDHGSELVDQRRCAFATPPGPWST